MSEQVYTVEEQRLVDTFGSISTMLEVLSSQQVFPLAYKSIRFKNKHSVDIEVFREFYDSSECKIDILVRVISESSNLPIHVIRLTKVGYLNDKESVRYQVYNMPYFRGKPKVELVSGRTTSLITLSDLEVVLLGGNMKEDVFSALYEVAPKLRDYLFTCCGILTQSS